MKEKHMTKTVFFIFENAEGKDKMHKESLATAFRARQAYIRDVADLNQSQCC